MFEYLLPIEIAQDVARKLIESCVEHGEWIDN